MNIASVTNLFSCGLIGSFGILRNFFLGGLVLIFMMPCSTFAKTVTIVPVSPDPFCGDPTLRKIPKALQLVQQVAAQNMLKKMPKFVTSKYYYTDNSGQQKGEGYLTATCDFPKNVAAIKQFYADYAQKNTFALNTLLSQGDSKDKSYLIDWVMFYEKMDQFKSQGDNTIVVSVYTHQNNTLNWVEMTVSANELRKNLTKVRKEIDGKIKEVLNFILSRLGTVNEQKLAPSQN